MEYPHQPVLAEAAVDDLVTAADGIYVDGTAGSGGHSVLIGSRLSPGGLLISVDRDPEAVRLTRQRLAKLKTGARVIQGNYSDLDMILKDLGIREISGLLLDLGMSSYQLEGSGRGFSFNRDEPLDMRMDPGENLTARDLVNTLSQRDLELLLRDYGEERMAKSISKAIVKARRERSLDTTGQVANLVKALSRPSHRPKAKHPATRTFQALRIAVNRELEHLDIFLDKVPSFIAEGGRFVALSYHSLEDRRVKRAMVAWEKACTCPPDFPRCVCGGRPVFKRLYKRGRRPGIEEIEGNPRARSAVMRASERI
ncbi:MAG: 16S rRNA (cytosine(1402)-N(4))-methyltransferase RsmH [Deltaproteobacteria bacterium]|nr:16S rRNA (cytosine(1402)-N(4))-methyltransferase RsmH [Deltaproteobacteria bacterium]MBW1816359.1 16S rRNA (cytosine(1402)-N(4))-methyltransferase RsmH [Deltaproteobacteria bacterium]MBW2285537.1 16S rRNA (cytosine(1402)-N(4))-methyltransferase RsmH [Deltaproteobacteria bacterium]